VETYKALEELCREGKCKSIGVSNFNIPQLKEVLANCEIKPVNNQIEIHPYLQNEKLVEFCQKNEIVVSAYAPIGAGQKTTLAFFSPSKTQ
jgi:diketogulonate reductase-like aldo/keto reductase